MLNQVSPAGLARMHYIEESAFRNPYELGSSYWFQYVLEMIQILKEEEASAKHG